MPDVTNLTIEAFGASVANKTTAVGGATGFLGFLSQVDWMGLAGVLLAALGLMLSFYFQNKRDKREQVEHEARLRAMSEKEHD